MKVFSAALIGVCALCVIYVGIAQATSGGGDTIATALVVTPGVQEAGSTALFTDNCLNGYEFWTLQLEQGDVVKITWGASTALDTVGMFFAGTTDSENDGCLYASGWSHWTTSPEVSLSSGAAPPVRPAEMSGYAPADGSYPLLFLDTTGVNNAGAYSFTAVVLHAASVSLPHHSTIPGIGTLTASVLAPDSSAISDSTLKLTLNGFWSTVAGASPSAHKLATATPTDGSATFTYSLPARLWGKKIRMDISGGDSNYQAVTTQKESVKVLVPTGVPVVVSATAIKAASKLLRQPIYWVGPRKGLHYEFTRTTNGYVYVRYLPHGVHAGALGQNFLIVATYPFPGAYSAVKKYAKGKAVAGPHGSIYFVRPDDPRSVLVAFPKIPDEIEVYDPSPAVARSIAATGRVRPVR